MKLENIFLTNIYGVGMQWTERKKGVLIHSLTVWRDNKGKVVNTFSDNKALEYIPFAMETYIKTAHKYI